MIRCVRNGWVLGWGWEWIIHEMHGICSLSVGIWLSVGRVGVRGVMVGLRAWVGWERGGIVVLAIGVVVVVGSVLVGSEVFAIWASLLGGWWGERRRAL